MSSTAREGLAAFTGDQEGTLGDGSFQQRSPIRRRKAGLLRACEPLNNLRPLTKG